MGTAAAAAAVQTLHKSHLLPLPGPPEGGRPCRIQAGGPQHGPGGAVSAVAGVGQQRWARRGGQALPGPDDSRQ